MKAARFETLEHQRISTEQEYRDALIVALRECAAGKWGLFEQNKGAMSPAMGERFMGAAARKVAALEQQVAELRSKLGYTTPCDLSARLQAYRRQHGPNTLGEQRLAQMFLTELVGTEKT